MGQQLWHLEIKLRPTDLVLYVVYTTQSDIDAPGDLFDNQTIHFIQILRHTFPISQIKQFYYLAFQCGEPTHVSEKSRIVVSGGFNLHHIVWNVDDTERYFLPQNIVTHTKSEYVAAACEFFQNIQQFPMFQLSNIKNIAWNVLDLISWTGLKTLVSVEHLWP